MQTQKKETRISQRVFPNRTYIEMKKQFFFLMQI